MTVEGRDEERLTPAEVELVLRRAAELGARRRGASVAKTVSTGVLVEVASAAGISERDVRRALFDLYGQRTAEPFTLARRFYGPGRLRLVREIEHPPERIRARLEELLKLEQGLKMRRKTEASTLFDPGDMLGAVRRALDFSGNRSLLKARSVELRVEGVGDGLRSDANLTADVSNQRSENLSLGAILSATLALPLAIAGFESWPYFLGVLPALVTPVAGFKLVYQKACADARRAMDDLLDDAEEGARADELSEERLEQPPGPIPGLKPIPRFTRSPEEEE